jgi:hypothetical protein
LDGRLVASVQASAHFVSGLAPLNAYCVEIRSQPSPSDPREDGRSNPPVSIHCQPPPRTCSSLAKEATQSRFSGAPTDTTIAGFRIKRDGAVVRTMDPAARSAAVYHQFRSGVAWSFEPLPTLPLYGIFRAFDPAIVASGDGRLHVAAGASGTLVTPFVMYWTNVTGTWQPHTLVNGASRSAPLRVGASANRHAVYVTDRDVRYLTTRQ